MPVTTSRTIAGISTYVLVDTSPATWTRPVVTSVSTATRPCGSSARIASRMLSEIWSQILSGWPSVTDSDVNRRSSVIDPPGSDGRDSGDGVRTSMPTAGDIRPPAVARGHASLSVTQAQLVLVDLVKGDRQRLVLDGRVDERAHVVEEVALVQVRVVVVDLTRTLRCVDHELVRRADLLEKANDRGLVDPLVVSGHG